jgi:hypothetical protein
VSLRLCGYHAEVLAFVGKKAHSLLRLVGQGVSRVGDRGLNIVLGEMRVGFSNPWCVVPSPSFRKISSTVTRVPRIIGLPSMTFGLISIRSCVDMIFSLPHGAWISEA